MRKTGICLIIISILAGVRLSGQECPAGMELFNIGPKVNSPSDELMPFFGNGRLFFIRGGSPDSVSTGGSVYSAEPDYYSFPYLPKPFRLANNAEFGKNESEDELYTGDDVIIPLDGPEAQFKLPGYLSAFNYDTVFSGWSNKFTPAEKLNSPELDLQPAVSRDGSYIVFVSTRQGEGSEGGSDLFIARRLNIGRQNWDEFWTTPQNLNMRGGASTPINTEFNEIAPFIDRGDTLYFASNGHRGDVPQMFTGAAGNEDDPGDIYVMEGQMQYDILKAAPIYDTPPGTNERIVVGFENPVKLKFPFNTEFNEIGITRYDSSLVISSDRPGGFGGYDLYACGIPQCDTLVYRILINNSESCPPRFKLQVIREEELISTININEMDEYLLRLPFFREYSFVLSNSCNPAGDTLVRQNLCVASSFSEDTLAFDIGCSCYNPHMPVIIEARSFCCGDEAVSGELTVLDKNGLELETQFSRTGFFRLKCDYSEKITLVYQNDCLPEGMIMQEFSPAAKLANPDTIRAEFALSGACCGDAGPVATDKIDFYITGYPYPNTVENVNSLLNNFDRMTDRMMEFGSSFYIDFPNEEYFRSIGTNRGRALENSADALRNLEYLVMNEIHKMESGCCSKLVITLKGRYFREMPGVSAIYTGKNTESINPEFSLIEGQVISKNKLALMMAYFTAEELKKRLSGHSSFAQFENAVEWKIEHGGGSASNIAGRVEVFTQCIE